MRTRVPAAGFPQRLQNHPLTVRVIFRRYRLEAFIDFPDVGTVTIMTEPSFLRRDLLFRQCQRHRCGEVANDLLERISSTVTSRGYRHIH